MSDNTYMFYVTYKDFSVGTRNWLMLVNEGPHTNAVPVSGREGEYTPLPFRNGLEVSLLPNGVIKTRTCKKVYEEVEWE